MEVGVIISLCFNFVELYMVCEFDYWLIDFVGDEVLFFIGMNCLCLKVLYFVDYNELGVFLDDLNGDGFVMEDLRLFC